MRPKPDEMLRGAKMASFYLETEFCDLPTNRAEIDSLVSRYLTAVGNATLLFVGDSFTGALRFWPELLRARCPLQPPWAGIRDATAPLPSLSYFLTGYHACMLPLLHHTTRSAPLPPPHPPPPRPP